MKKITVMMLALCISSVDAFAGDVPQVAVLPWTNSLDIVDYESHNVSLSYAAIIDSRVNGVVPSHDSKYDSWTMEFVARFDQPIRANEVVFYGYMDSNNSAWTTINEYAGEQKNNCWHPVRIPATPIGTEANLVSLMFGSSGDYAICYNSGISSSASLLIYGLFGKYNLSFTELVRTFYCGIAFLNNNHLGMTCTIDIVLTNPSDASDKVVLDTISYRHDYGKYRDGDPGQWFNCKIGWWNELPADYQRCVNCTVVDPKEDEVMMAGRGKIEVDGDFTMSITSNIVKRKCFEKKFTTLLNNYYCMSFEELSKRFPLDAEGKINGTIGCGLYQENGVTNLLGLVRDGETNKVARLVPTSNLSFSDVTKIEMYLIKYDSGSTFARYTVNDIYFSYDNFSEIPVFEYPEENIFSIQGWAVVEDAYGDESKVPAGLTIETL